MCAYKVCVPALRSATLSNMHAGPALAPPRPPSHVTAIHSPSDPSSCPTLLPYPAAVCAVLIGCLPTYSQAGLAAPILLSLLRLVQGIAVGGELGTAVVFMHELAPSGKKTKGGSVIFVGVTAGIMMGTIVALIINAAIPPGEEGGWCCRV